MSDADRAISRLFVLRGDGSCDYYPLGFKKPGYRVDTALLDEAVRIERGGSKRALIGIGIIALLLYSVLPNMAKGHPWLALVTNSPIIRLGLALPLLAAVYLVVMAQRRQTLQNLFRHRAATSPPLSAEAILARRAQNWRATPRFSRIAMFIALPLAALAMGLYASHRIGQPDALAPWEAALAGTFAVGLVAIYGFAVYRVMSFRRVASAGR